MMLELGCAKCGQSKSGFRIYVDADDADKYNIRRVSDMDSSIGEYPAYTIECRKCGKKHKLIIGSD